jgi:hypothetical protein
VDVANRIGEGLLEKAEDGVEEVARLALDMK